MTDPIPLSAAFRRMRETFEDEKRWTQLSVARSPSGHVCRADDAHASCWCVSAMFGKQPLSERDFDRGWSILKDLCGGPIPKWNDHRDRTIADVRDLLNRAIIKADEAETVG